MRALVILCCVASLSACSDGTDDPSETSAGAGGGGGASGASSSATGPQGVQCGNVRCTTANEYCGFADDLCGETDDSPKCQPFPPCQPEEVTCGCDGVSYPSGCDAADVSRGIRHEGACLPPDGKYTCTYEYQPPIYCELGAEFCMVTVVPRGDYPLACVPLLDNCTVEAEDCSCAACGGTYCAVSEDLQEVTVYCP